MAQGAPALQLLARATQALKAGRPGDAVPLLREAAAMQPGNPGVQHDLGLACLETGLLSEAVTALRKAVAVNPRFTDAHFRLGMALEQAGEVREAIVAYDRATELLPSFTEAWYRAGALVFLLGHRMEAIGCFRRAAAAGPKTTFGRLGKARALLAEDRDAEAEKVLRQTLALDPGCAVAQDLLGNLLASDGRFAEARVLFERAVAQAPGMAGTYYDLVRCWRLTQADADLLARMAAALGTPGLAPEQRMRVHLAIGKAADDLGDYELAMRHFDTADEVRRRVAAFDADAFEREIDRMVGRFTPELVARAPELGVAEPRPVLIVGMPRSGTTLTEQIISGHPDAAAAGELSFWGDRGTEWLQAGAAGLKAPFLQEAGRDYLALLRTVSPSAARVTDKMPFNFIWAGLIHLALPHATIIHCRRQPIDSALSIHQTHFNPQVAFPTGGAELVRYFHNYQRLTAHWRRVLPVDRFIEIDYESLTDAPEPVIRRMVAACGLPWSDVCLRPELNQRSVKTPSKWQARQPIYRDAVARWRRYEPWLGPLRALLS